VRVAARAWAAALALGAAVASGGAARAQELKLDVHPGFGPEGVSGEGWSTFHVRLEHGGRAPLKGVVRVSPEMGYRSGLVPSRSEAPFSLAPGSPAVVTLPVQGGGALSVEVSAVDARGETLATTSVRASMRPEPLLVDAHQPSRLVGALRGAKVAVHYSPGYGRTAPKPGLQVVAPWVDPRTGEAAWPTRAAEYGDVTAMLVPSDLLARLGGAELEALGGFVQGGGTLAVTIKRPEDLRSAALKAFCGGELRRAGAAEHLRSSPSARLDTDQPGASPPDDDDEPAKPGSPPRPKREGAPIYPGEALRASFAGYEGGNAAASEFGATAPYGLGEVHLLAFDPSEPTAAVDPWAQARLVELVRHAHDRRATLFVGRNPGVVERLEVGEVRKQLDPNEGTRWSVLVAALLLVAYATLAGPVNFALASRAGQPLKALRRVAIASALAFGVIVLLGTIAKGVRGRSQRLSLVEASGGMGRGVARRYRGFFTPRARSLRVEATDAGSLVSMAGEANDRATLRVERSGVALDNVLTLPSQTVVVREDGPFDLRGGLTLARAEGGDVRLTNRLGRDLVGVIVSAPGRGRYLLPTLGDGKSALASEGRPLSAHAPSTTPAGAMTLRDHGFGLIRDELDAAAPGLAAAWMAIASTAREKPIDWWPDAVPVAIGQLVGGEGALVDAGLRVKADRCLVRVLGYGGEP
jgi:hypothetical protein